jgi:hypothetical protein
MGTSVPSATLTDFLQHSGRILAEVEQGEIVLRRRVGDDLVMLTRRHWEALSESFLALAEAYRQTQVEKRPDDTRAPLRFALPWMSLLTPDDQTACIDEVTKATVVALDTGKLADLATVIAQWRATALATWDDQNNRNHPEHWLDEPQPLRRP